MKLFFYMIKKSRQQLKYLENENSFHDEMKSIVHRFYRDFIEIKHIFFKRWEFNFKFQEWIKNHADSKPDQPESNPKSQILYIHVIYYQWRAEGERGRGGRGVKPLVYQQWQLCRVTLVKRR